MTDFKEGVKDTKTSMAENKLQDDTDLLWYIQDAGRLASMGANSGIESLKGILSRPEYAGRIDQILADRVKEGMWDLDEQLYDELALTIIECQDFYSFSIHCGDMITDETRAMIEGWALHAGEQELQDETVEILENFTEKYPLAEEDQISPVYAPLSDTQKMMLNRVLIGDRSRYSVTKFDAETVDGQWVCRIRNKKGDVTVRKVISDDCALHILLDGEYTRVQNVTVGRLPMEEVSAGNWRLLVPYRMFDQKNRDYLSGPAQVVIKTSAYHRLICG